MHILKNKKIGIWGFGISGQATLRTLLSFYPQNHFTVFDKHFSDHAIQVYADHTTITFITQNPGNTIQFLENHDFIIPSPGIDLRPYKAYQAKYIAEVDLFYHFWKKPIIGITGTLGKTSITHLLGTLLARSDTSVVTGGNIGTGMLDLVTNKAEYALLELSSFQLEHCTDFVADVAVMTNLYPNHLDRHETMQNYLQAKQNIYLRQNSTQITIVPLDLATTIRADTALATKPLSIFCPVAPTPEVLKTFLPDDAIYYFSTDKTIIFKKKVSNKETIPLLSPIPELSYQENWLIIAAVLDALNIDIQKLISDKSPLSIPDYRLEKIATIDNIHFYNDSKSTIMQATIAACKAISSLSSNSIILLLGGVSKGVDRKPFIAQLKPYVEHIVCFGAEAEQLWSYCNDNQIHALTSPTLEEAFMLAQSCATNMSNYIVLSPGGASFDLFKDYTERGECFNRLVMQLQQYS